MTTHSFKSVGINASDNKKVIVKKKPIGFVTPIRLGDSKGDGVFKMHTDLKLQINDNLKNLILTNHGERLGFYDFGANLLPLVMESSDIDVEEEAMIRIKTTVSKYLPFVELQDFQSELTRQTEANLSFFKLRITYNIPMIDNTNKIIETTIVAGG